MRSGFETLVIWALLFVVFGPMVAAMLTDSVDQIVSTLAPYVGLAGVVVLVVLALRMVFRRY